MVSGYVSVAHRYWKDEWSREKNQSVYGSSASPVGVGSNLKVTLEGSHGLAEAMGAIKTALDHKSLTHVTSTLEAVAELIAGTVLPKTQADWTSVTLWELDDRRACRIERDALPGAVTMIENYRNLTLWFKASIDSDSQLALPRALVADVVDQAFKKGQGRWDAQCREFLFGALPGLTDVAIDLVRQLGEPSETSALQRCI